MHNAINLLALNITQYIMLKWLHVIEYIFEKWNQSHDVRGAN